MPLAFSFVGYKHLRPFPYNNSKVKLPHCSNRVFDGMDRGRADSFHHDLQSGEVHLEEHSLPLWCSSLPYIWQWNPVHKYLSTTHMSSTRNNTTILFNRTSSHRRITPINSPTLFFPTISEAFLTRWVIQTNPVFSCIFVFGLEYTSHWGLTRIDLAKRLV